MEEEGRRKRRKKRKIEKREEKKERERERKGKVAGREEGRKRKGSPIEGTSLRPYLLVSCFCPKLWNFKCTGPAWFKTKNGCTKFVLSIGTPPPSVYLGRH